MSLSERIRKVRKNAKLSQTEFGKKLGVSRSVIANIELDLNKTGVPDNIIKLICYSFKINEEWLLYGKGEMLGETSDDILQNLKNTYDLSNLEFSILEKYLKLDKSQRVSFEKFLDNILNTDPPENEHTKNQNDDTDTDNNKENKVIDNNNAISENKNTNDDTYITYVAARGNSEQKVKFSKKAIAEAINKPMSTEFDD